MRKLIGGAGALAMALGLAAAPDAPAAEGEIKHLDWSFQGIFGTYDRHAIQRGYQVFSQVCSSCHGARQFHFRHLEEVGFSQAEVEALAAEHQVEDGPDDSGDMYMRAALPRDQFPRPYDNDAAAAAANNGAVPPDLSVIVQGREGGADYVYSFLTGYGEPPEDVNVRAGNHWNSAYGGQVAMPNMLRDGGVSYADGTEATAEQQARDVAHFLAWLSEPNMEERKRMGFKVIGFLVVLAGMLYALKRKIWSRVAH